MKTILKRIGFGAVYALVMGCVIFTIREIFDLPALLITPIIAFAGVAVVDRVGKGFGITLIGPRKSPSDSTQTHDDHS